MPVILDVGCGQGKSFVYCTIILAQRLIGIDVEQGVSTNSRQIAQDNLQVELFQNDAAALELPDASVTLLFCHKRSTT